MIAGATSSRSFILINAMYCFAVPNIDHIFKINAKVFEG